MSQCTGPVCAYLLKALEKPSGHYRGGEDYR